MREENKNDNYKSKQPPWQTKAGRTSTHSAATGRDRCSLVLTGRDRAGRKHLGCCHAHRALAVLASPRGHALSSFIHSVTLKSLSPTRKTTNPHQKSGLYKKEGKKKKKKTKKNIKITQPPMLLVLGQMGELI